ncbi:MAG: YihY/virulence factor BrkB family protein [Gemmatimonadales bacterium]|nr:YihY/virulence factor BrkB family protein [Gemmatimonadales bacterium]
MRSGELGSLFKDALSGWWNDNVPRLGAALAYYTLFSLAPILIVAIAIAGFFFGREAVRGEIVGQIQDLVGFESAKAVQSMLEGASKPSQGALATVIGGLTFFIGATGAFLELQGALDAIWRVKPKEGAGLRELLVQRLVSFGLVIGVGFLLLVSLVISAALAALNKYMGALVPGLTELWLGLNVLVSLGVVTLLFAMVYKFLPDVELGWRDVWMGALVTAGLFTIGKSLIGLYLGTSSLASSYGAAGSVVVLLIWVYYSAQIVLLGAEFTRVYYERTSGTRPVPVVGAEPDPHPAQLTTEAER